MYKRKYKRDFSLQYGVQAAFSFEYLEKKNQIFNLLVLGHLYCWLYLIEGISNQFKNEFPDAKCPNKIY